MVRVLVAGNILDQPECRIVLEAKGYQLFCSSSLNDAVALVLEDPPDLLLLAKGFDHGKDGDLIKVVKACLQKANIPILLAVDSESGLIGLDWQRYPVDDLLCRPLTPELLLARIQLAQARMIRVFDNNPLSKLPGNTSILQAIQKGIDEVGQAAICYVDIDNFKPYNDHYGFSQGDEVILMVARIIVNVVEELAREGSFVGHVGGDDFVFIVQEEKMQAVCERILTHFEVVRNMFLNPEDIAAGGYTEKDRQGRETHFGLVSLSIAVIPTSHHRFKHYGEVSAAASQIKHEVKAKPGNNYMIDRRLGYSPGL